MTPATALLDPWTVTPACALLLIGLVRVASASIGVPGMGAGAACHC